MLRQKASICSRSCRGSYMSSTRILFLFFIFLLKSVSPQVTEFSITLGLPAKLCWEILSASDKSESCWVTCERKPHRGCWMWVAQGAQRSSGLSQGVSFSVHGKQWVGNTLIALWKPGEGADMAFLQAGSQFTAVHFQSRVLSPGGVTERL